MGMGSRLALLMLTAVLEDAYPPGVPPGAPVERPDPDFETAFCPVCGTESSETQGNRYWCQVCGIWFTPDETATTRTD